MNSNPPTSRAWLKLALLFLLTAASTFSFAQNNVVQPYLDFKPIEDLATRLMEGLLGATYSSPFTSGLTTNTLFGAIFLVFNVIVFAVGTVWASYGVIAGIVQTAHEGVVLGKRMNAIWMPVRMVTGIGGLIPAFGGFSLSQVAMILATSWGISFANYAYDQALQAAATTATLVSPGFSRTDPNKDANAMAQALFKQRLCENAFALKKSAFEKNVPTVEIPKADEIKQFDFSQVERNGTVVGRAVGTDYDNTKCFAIGLKRKTYLGGLIDQEGRWGSSAVGFRSGAVDYAQINEESWNGYASNFPEFVARIHAIADSFQSEVLQNTGKQVRVPNEEIRATGVWFGGAAKVKNLDHKTIKEDALKNMAKFGWFGAGSFYSTHAEVNAAVMQAADATEFVIINPANRAQNPTSGDFEQIYRMAEESTGNAGKGMAQPGTSFCLVGQNATGNCSFGQKIVEVMLDAGTAGAGGAADVVDPIIALKNIGDYMMTLGEGILAASYFSGTVAQVAGMASGPAVAVATVVAPAVAITASLANDLVQALAGLAPIVGGLLFAVGALCAIYIPMVPFINWVSGLVQYCCIVVESMAAAPLWALAHLQADGEGMGQRTERGYLYLLNLLFRPILMVVAFFAASALVILLGSLVMQMFIPAMAAAQGNSITGIFSAIGYVFLFFVLMNTVIQGLFHLITELADDALGWVGGIGRSNIGRDTESKVSQMFMMGGRFGSGSAAGAVGAVAKNLGSNDKPKAPPTGNGAK
ncbi:DotA/TraY family protein [Polaromonas sp.]|uniref:DotA/TraY family protein n=1 Tax=Polaromonas sp. TaxID=1869339 RepID=UPI003BA84B1E